MTAPRPYAPQRSVPEAMAELRRCAGSQFDPAVVHALAELVLGPDRPHDRSARSDEVGTVRDHA